MQKFVFFTDDDQDDLHLIREITEALGRNSLLFHNGNEMLNTLGLQNEPPQIIFRKASRWELD